jgi:hypothetical protein
MITHSGTILVATVPIVRPSCRLLWTGFQQVNSLPDRFQTSPGRRRSRMASDQEEARMINQIQMSTLQRTPDVRQRTRTSS